MRLEISRDEAAFLLEVVAFVARRMHTEKDRELVTGIEDRLTELLAAGRPEGHSRPLWLDLNKGERRVLLGVLETYRDHFRSGFSAPAQPREKAALETLRKKLSAGGLPGILRRLFG